MRSLSSARVAALHALRGRFGPRAAAEKTTALSACAACRLARPRIVLRYHDTLLFMAAYPEGRRLTALLEQELARIEQAGPALFRSPGGADALEGSGIAGARITAGFSLALIEWLMARHPGQVELAWDGGHVGEGLGDLLALAVLPAERDGRTHEALDMQAWVRLAAGGDGAEPGQLRWVLERIRELLPDEELRDLVAERTDLRVRWRLTADGTTRTRTRFPPRPPYRQRGPLRRSFDVPRLLRRPLPGPARLTPAAARDLIDTARGVLAVRERETDPVTCADPRDVTLFRLDRGLDLAIFGLQPDRRLPIESFFGYVAARNRVPVAYGGGWIMGHRAEIGVHLFDAFRGGESAYLFGAVLRTYRGHYDVRRFQVDPYQFGDDNPEAIRSGAFWFYYRFGFRPRDPGLAEIAAAEWASIRADRAARTPAAVLRRFTASPLVLDLGPGAADAPHPDPTRLGVAVTAEIQARFGADRAAARRWARRRVSRLLPPATRRSWSDEEARAFDRLCPLVAVLPGVERWPAADRRRLAAVMRAKGGPRERNYVRAVQRHDRLRAALAELDASAEGHA